MEIWLEDIAQQLSLARMLRDSDLIPGKRIAIILVDNVVEFLIKVHGEDIILRNKVLKKYEWEEEKRHFDKLVNRVLPRTNVSAFVKEILDYHELRNNLYHGVVPASVHDEKINKYIGIAEVLLEKIFDIHISQDEWNARVKTTGAKVSPSTPKSKFVTFERIDDAIRFEATGQVRDRHAIMLVMHGFGVDYGYAPSYDQLARSLTHSAHSMNKNTLSVGLSVLREKGLVRRDEYSLTTEGRKWLTSKFGLG